MKLKIKDMYKTNLYVRDTLATHWGQGIITRKTKKNLWVKYHFGRYIYSHLHALETLEHNNEFYNNSKN